MTKAILTSLAFAAAILANGQNLVSNGGFEPEECPSTGTTLSTIAPPWIDPFNTAEHFGPCSNNGGPNINNSVGPRTGDGNLGIAVYGSQNDQYNREYAASPLRQQLSAGQRYRVSYWVHPVLVAPNINAAIDGPGALFVESLADFQQIAGGLDFNFTSDSALHPTDVISDRQEWTQVCMNFIAEGYERYIILGSFRRDEDMTAELLGGTGAINNGYYLIDDLVVEPIDDPILDETVNICPDGTVTLSVPAGLVNGSWDDGSTGTTREVDEPGFYFYGYQDGICYRIDEIEVVEVNCTECSIYYPNAFTPNGDGLNDTWQPLFECDPIEYRIEIYDRIGNLVYESYDHNASWAPEDSQKQDTYVAVIRMTYELNGERALIEERQYINLIK